MKLIINLVSILLFFLLLPQIAWVLNWLVDVLALIGFKGLF